MRLEVQIYNDVRKFYDEYWIEISTTEIVINDQHYSLLPEKHKKKDLLKCFELIECGLEYRLARICAFIKFKFILSMEAKIMALLIYEALTCKIFSFDKHILKKNIIPNERVVSIEIKDNNLYIEDKHYILNLELICETDWSDLSTNILLINSKNEEIIDDTYINEEFNLLISENWDTEFEFET